MTEERISPAQWKALIAAWLGWAFDGLDGYLYLLVSGPLVRQLLEKHADGPVAQSEVIAKAALIQAVFLVGWAVGGAVFGRLGDRIGRTKTLTLTVLTYAVFTGLTAFAGSWWHLLIFRFIAALGIGGEWAAGSALVSEILHRKHRAWASATLQSGYMVGCICASLTVKSLAAVDPRWVFLIGVLPALLTVWIRHAVPEPEHWKEAVRDQQHPPVSALFARALRRTTLLMMALTSIALTTVWAFLYFGPQIIRAMPDVKGWTPGQVGHLVSNVSIAYLLVNIVANYFATYLAKHIGYRRAFALLMAASFGSFLIAFSSPLTLGSVYWKFCLVAFFALGLFGLFPLYIPPLFPTLVRTLGAGFTYNVGRLVAAGGTMAGGWIATTAGGELHALYLIGFLFIAGVAVSLVIPEPPHEEDARP